MAAIVVLLSVPAWGTACLVLCAPAHGGDLAGHCDTARPDFHGAASLGSMHDCGSHGGVFDVALIAARIDVRDLVSSAPVDDPAAGLAGFTGETRLAAANAPPIPPPSPARAPLVLRI